jgi:AhpC/TSA family
MTNTFIEWALACGMVALGAAFQQSPPPAQPPPPLVPTLKAGDAAPQFALQGSDGKTHRLSDYKGKTVVLAWFPKAFTGG